MMIDWATHEEDPEESGYLQKKKIVSRQTIARKVLLNVFFKSGSVIEKRQKVL